MLHFIHLFTSFIPSTFYSQIYTCLLLKQERLYVIVRVANTWYLVYPGFSSNSNTFIPISCTQQLSQVGVVITSIPRWINWGTEIWNKLFKITPLVNDGAKTQTQVVWLYRSQERSFCETQIFKTCQKAHTNLQTLKVRNSSFLLLFWNFTFFI